MKAKARTAISAIALAAAFAVSAVSAVHAQSPDAARTSLSAAAATWKARVAWDPLTGDGRIVRGRDLVRFSLGFPAYLVGTDRIIRAPSIELTAEGLVIPLPAVAAISGWFNDRDAERASRFSIAAVLIDPGHGGKDPGAIGEFGSGKDKFKIQEKDVALSVAKDVRARLQAKWPERKILMTREGDTFPTLDERVDKANEAPLGENEAVIYVSIHANASFNASASGFEIWYLDPDYRRTVMDPSKAEGVDKSVLPILNAMLEEEYTTESVILAGGIREGLRKAIGDSSTDRGIREEEWFVVRNAKMPSVLVEVGFVTNEHEARLLADPSYLRKLGDGIYNGIVDFVDYFEHRKGNGAP